MKRIVLAASLAAGLFVGGCSPAQRADTPFDLDVPGGGVVIYRAEHGLDRCGIWGNCPSRIVRIGDVCITEDFIGPFWQLAESKPCSLTPVAN